MALKTHGLNHIHLLVRDLQKSVAFYSDAFGYQPFGDGGDHGDMVFLIKPGTPDVVTLRLGDGPDVGRGAGIDHFGFTLVDASELDAAISEIERCGGTLLEKTTLGPGIPTAFIADPDGYRIQI